MSTSVRYILISSIILINSVLPGLHAQTAGYVFDEKGEALPSVRVVCSNAVNKGTYSNLEGKFSFDFGECDSVCFLYIGFKRQCKAVKDFRSQDSIILIANPYSLKEVQIKAADPISSQYSVVLLEKLDIYLNPVSSGDPLKAITFLPASTNASETADPELRGSSADRSRVILNGIPIRNPVRNGQFNGLGNFSLFNTEIVDKLYVYASNPPLTFSNTSAGAVEILTNTRIDNNQWQFSGGLANVGLFHQRQLGNQESFVQAYSNYQFHQGFLGINRPARQLLKRFGNADIGINLRLQPGKKWSFNSFNYLIDEFYDAQLNMFAFRGDLSATKTRYFSANNWVKSFAKGSLRVNYLLDLSQQGFYFGNIQSELKSQTHYAAIDYKHFISNNFHIQTGICNNFWRLGMSGRLPVSFFNLETPGLSYGVDTAIHMNNPEFYGYGHKEFGNRWGLSGGYRAGIGNQLLNKSYHSLQTTIRFTPDKKHKFILGGGLYNNFSSPSLFNPVFILLKSGQGSLDYTYKSKKSDFILNAAVFAKSETGRQLADDFQSFNEVKTLGFEVSVEKNITNRWKAGLANTYLKRNLHMDSEKYRAGNAMNYFVKAFIQYNNPLVLNASLTVVTRPGLFYTPVSSAVFDSVQNVYTPIFNEGFNTAQYGDYFNLSLALSKYIPFDRKAIVLFLSVTNLSNEFNQAGEWYNRDYSARYFAPFQRRTVYFGATYIME